MKFDSLLPLCTRLPQMARRHLEIWGRVLELCCAKGAVSLPAWGNAPGFVKRKQPVSAEGAIHFRHQFDPAAWLKRAFSACCWCNRIPGAVPQANADIASSALNRSAKARRRKVRGFPSESRSGCPTLTPPSPFGRERRQQLAVYFALLATLLASCEKN